MNLQQKHNFGLAHLGMLLGLTRATLTSLAILHCNDFFSAGPGALAALACLPGLKTLQIEALHCRVERDALAELARLENVSARNGLRWGGGGVGRRRVGGLRRVPALPTPEPTCLFLSLAQTTAGYSPFLCFAVPDLQEVVTRCLALGATLDGPIHYPPAGPVAALRAPDGHMLSLHEVAGGEGLGGGVGESQAGSA